MPKYYIYRTSNGEDWGGVVSDDGSEVEFNQLNHARTIAKMMKGTSGTDLFEIRSKRNGTPCGTYEIEELSIFPDNDCHW